MWVATFSLFYLNRNRDGKWRTRGWKMGAFPCLVCGNEGGWKRGQVEFSTWAHQETFLPNWEEKWGRKMFITWTLLFFPFKLQSFLSSLDVIRYNCKFIKITFSILSLFDPLHMKENLKHFILLTLFYHSYIFYLLTFPISQLYKGKLKQFISFHFSIIPTFSIFSLSILPTKQTFWKMHPHSSVGGSSQGL